MPAGPFRPGDKVPTTGIYTVSHYQHRMPHDVFAVEGDQFPPCRRCGSRASFVLAQAASHIDSDHDFSRSSDPNKTKRAKAGSPKVE
jgi:hypothetical protein